ncbi:hypothetical protein BEL04_06155 [Mucilaginibacter sp. PPCGB 2223]|uniref:T9SS type B sorting domain-containing protein n=1 Tax=Mucilaginibacter sp. PPCGB 2223 TaxID=1886027 RepID=UPI000824642D|nr:gliding motility-associated C-terminal domain-containing protein [Mucilaginibacter sp. PPCGB 2223]OCX53866.1 hypothetical protein BEL04_06155 [Mucilaginibacter sp. PPCGB 2223]
MNRISIRISLCLAILILFSVKVSAITITSFLPNVGVPGTLITITGTDMGNPTSVKIGGKAAIVLSNTGLKMVAMVMPGAESGNITIVNAHGKAVSATNFMLVVTPNPGGIQGTKLIGKDTSGAAAQGTSVAFSSTGYTAIVGGPKDHNNTGAAWIYTYSGKQQGAKLVGKDTIGLPAQGTSVAISADGNTAIVGGPADNHGHGAIWVFTRTDTVWKQQGLKLTATGTSPIGLGSSVSLSADGNTLVAEAPADSGRAGAAYVFTRKDTVWAQQGPRLTAKGSAADTAADQSVSLSADGNTFIMGGHTDSVGIGAAWIFVRKNNTWLRQDSMLVGAGYVNHPNQGHAVAISADGNIAAIGGYTDHTQTGAVWIYKRDTTANANTWKQMGKKVISIDTVGKALQGCSVSLNADGTVLLFGGLNNNSATGAGWVYTRSDTTWTPFTQITGADATNGSYAGNSVSLSADGIYSVMGGYGHSNGKGIAWIAASGYGVPCKLPQVVTNAATGISPDGATLHGMVDAAGALITSVVFELATLSDMSNSIVIKPTTGTTPLSGSLGNTAFTAVVNKLQPSTTYYFRIVGANYCTGITYGNTLQFTTPAEAPGSGLSEKSIPNAFSPNNDGINDRWEIPFLSKYPNCSVKIFNRSGQVVFASTGYQSSWDGRFKNTELPSGAYFYIIDLKNSSSSISGSVNLVR